MGLVYQGILAHDLARLVQRPKMKKDDRSDHPDATDWEESLLRFDRPLTASVVSSAYKET